MSQTDVMFRRHTPHLDSMHAGLQYSVVREVVLDESWLTQQTCFSSSGATESSVRANVCPIPRRKWRRASELLPDHLQQVAAVEGQQWQVPARLGESRKGLRTASASATHAPSSTLLYSL